MGICQPRSEFKIAKLFLKVMFQPVLGRNTHREIQECAGMKCLFSILNEAILKPEKTHK